MPTYRIKGEMRRSGVKTTRTYQEPTEQDAINAALVDGLDVDKVVNTHRRNYVIFCSVAPTLLILFLITIIPWPSFGAPTLPTIKQLFNDFEMRVNSQYDGKEIFGRELCQNFIDNHHLRGDLKITTQMTLWTSGYDNNAKTHAIESFPAYYVYDEENQTYKRDSWVDNYWESVRMIQKYTDIPDNVFMPYDNIQRVLVAAEYSEYQSSDKCIYKKSLGRTLITTKDAYGDYIIKHDVLMDWESNITYKIIIQTHEWDPYWLGNQKTDHASR